MPTPAARVALTLRLPAALHAQLAAMAEREASSINREAVLAIQERIAADTHRGKR